MNEAPTLRIRVNDHPLPPAVEAEIAEVRVLHTDDGADELELSVNARSMDGFIGSGGVALQAGNLVTVESGYGPVEVHHGRFEIVRHELALDTTATLKVVGYDAMHRMIGPHSKQGRAFMFVQRDSDIAREYANWYGFQHDIDDTPENPQFERTIHAGHKSKHGPKPTKVVAYPSWIKEVGTTDLEDLKVLASRNGFLPPRVRYVDGVDVLRFRNPLSLDEQIAANPRDEGLLVWRWGPRSSATSLAGGDCILKRFSPDYSTSQQPLAVRVVGRDAAGALVVVEIEVSPGEEPKIVYEGFVEDRLDRGPQQAAGKAWLDKQRDGAFSDSAGLLVQVLGQYQATKGTKVVKRVVRTKGKTVGPLYKTKTKVITTTEETKQQWWGREVLAVGVVQSHLSARQFGERWIQTRREGFQSATFEFVQVPTTDWIDTQQVYPVVGAPPEYEGFWMTREVVQSWRGRVHSVSGRVQRVPSARPLSEVFA